MAPSVRVDARLVPPSTRARSTTGRIPCSSFVLHQGGLSRLRSLEPSSEVEIEERGGCNSDKVLQNIREGGPIVRNIISSATKQPESIACTKVRVGEGLSRGPSRRGWGGERGIEDVRKEICDDGREGEYCEEE